LGSHPNRQLQDDWKNFGQDNFDYQILEELPQPEDYTGDYRKDVKTLEELILDELEPYDEKGYNVRKKVYSFNR
jgi:hypothetical protein